MSVKGKCCSQVWTNQTAAESLNMPRNSIQRVAGQRWINLAQVDPSAYRALHTALKTLPFWHIPGAGVSRCLGIMLTALPIWFASFYTAKLEVCAWYKRPCPPGVHNNIIMTDTSWKRLQIPAVLAPLLPVVCRTPFPPFFFFSYHNIPLACITNANHYYRLWHFPPLDIHSERKDQTQLKCEVGLE